MFLSFLAILLVSSCSIENNSEDFYFEVMPIESVETPESFVFGQTYEISITYNRTTSCHEFYDFVYDIDEHERTIAVVDVVYTNAECEETNELVTVSFDFSVTSLDTYLFKFYKGKDDNGDDIYHLVEIPVGMGFTSNDTPNANN